MCGYVELRRNRLEICDLKNIPPTNGNGYRYGTTVPLFSLVNFLKQQNIYKRLKGGV
jgi:hypothetical protein